MRQILLSDPASPRDLADDLDEPLQNVSYHVRCLADRDLVRLVDTEPVRGSIKHWYSGNLEEEWARALIGVDSGSGSMGEHRCHGDEASGSGNGNA